MSITFELKDQHGTWNLVFLILFAIGYQNLGSSLMPKIWDSTRSGNSELDATSLAQTWRRIRRLEPVVANSARET